MDKNKISLIEAKKERRDLEREILCLLKNFEDKNNVEIYGIDMDHLRSNDDYSARVIDVKIKILL